MQPEDKTPKTSEIIEALERTLLELVAVRSDADAFSTRIRTFNAGLAALNTATKNAPAELVDGLLATSQALEPVVAALEARELELDHRLVALVQSALSAFRIASGPQGVRSSEAAVKKTLTDLTALLQRVLPKRAASSAEASPDDGVWAFLANSDGLLPAMERVSGGLLQSPQQGIQELFRLFHTLKGTAAIFGLEKLEQYAHAVEDLLQPVRRGELPVDEALSDFIDQALGNLKTLFEAYQQDPTLEARAYDLAPDLDRVRKFLARPKDAPQKLPKQNNSLASEKPVPLVSPEAHANRVYLSIIIAGKRLRVPAADVLEILRRPELLPVPRAKDPALTDVPKISAMVRASLGLVPVLGLGEGATSGDWFMVLREQNPAGSPGRAPLIFCIPIDEVEGVVEESFSDSSAPSSVSTLFLR